MSLEAIFNPQSVAVIGATDREGSVGLGLCKNLLGGRRERKIFFVNPNRRKVLGEKTYDRVEEIEERLDLVVVAVPSEIVPQVMEETARKGAGAAIVISAGFGESGEEGKKREERVARITREAGISLVGPNCLGVIRPSRELNATFAPATPKEGGIGFISQSGALIDSVIDSSLEERYGFSSIVSLGNAAGVKIHDLLEYLEEDEETRVISLYIEGVKEGRRFLKALREVKKPVVALKAGQSEKGQKAVSSHTGSLAGEGRIYSGVFKQTGTFEALNLTQLFDASKALAWQPRFEGETGILTNGGGAGVLAVDSCERLGLGLARIKKGTLRKLKRSGLMHPSFSGQNPLDVIGDAGPERYRAALWAMLSQREIKSVMVIQTLQIMTQPLEDAKILIEAREKWPEKPIVACFMGGRLTRESVEVLEKNGIPNYPDPNRAALALKSLQKNE